MNKYVIGVFVLAITITGFSLNSSDNDSYVDEVGGLSNSKLIVLEDPYDFGEIEIFAGKVSTNFTLKNEGEEAVTITKAATSCMCTEGEIAGLTFGMHGSDVKSVVIPPGGEEVVQATYDPLAHGPKGVGPVTRTLQLDTDSAVTPRIELRFSANVVKTEE